ncbi:MAG: hypothetical protein KDB37_20260, partial [Ilumatobacter sp.]|nr:hypothetical protein [Ilumatobacter sp.]
MLSRLNTRSRPSRPSRTGARRTSSGGGSGGGPITLIADQYGAAGDTGESGDWGLLRNGTWEYIAFGSCNGGGAAAFDFKLDGVNQTKQAYHTWASNYANYRVGVAANEGVFDADAVLKAAGNCNQLYNTVFRVNAGYEIKQVKSFGPDFGPAAAEPITLTFDAPCAAGNLVIFQIVESGTFTRPAN